MTLKEEKEDEKVVNGATQGSPAPVKRGPEMETEDNTQLMASVKALLQLAPQTRLQVAVSPTSAAAAPALALMGPRSLPMLANSSNNLHNPETRYPQTLVLPHLPPLPVQHKSPTASLAHRRASLPAELRISPNDQLLISPSQGQLLDLAYVVYAAGALESLCDYDDTRLPVRDIFVVGYSVFCQERFGVLKAVYNELQSFDGPLRPDRVTQISRLGCFTQRWLLAPCQPQLA